MEEAGDSGWGGSGKGLFPDTTNDPVAQHQHPAAAVSTSGYTAPITEPQGICRSSASGWGEGGDALPSLSCFFKPPEIKLMGCNCISLVTLFPRLLPVSPFTLSTGMLILGLLFCSNLN